MKSFDTLIKAQPVREEHDAVIDRTEIDSMMRRIFEKARFDEAAPEGVKDTTEHKSSAPRRDFDTAFELLDRVSKTFDLLVTRFQRMQTKLDEQADRAAVRAAEQEHAIEQWKRLALDLKTQVEVADANVVGLRAKCEAAEARADLCEKRTASLEETSRLAADEALKAESLSTKLHDKVVTVFGIGSRAHAVLEAVATSEAE